MPVRIRSNRRRRRGTIAVRRRFLITAVLGAVALVLAAVGASQHAAFRVPIGLDAPTIVSTEAAVSNDSLDASIATEPERTVFPYSVVPGGVNSVDELRSAIADDAVVADHYKSFDLSKAHVERLTAPRFAHVSYRLGEHVYWTRNALVLPAGERVITDGKNIARTRCGNQVASGPGVTSPAEPSATVLDTPVITRPLTSVALLTTPQWPSSATPSRGDRAGAGDLGSAAFGSGVIPGAVPGGFAVGGGSFAGGGQPSETSSVEACPSGTTACADDGPDVQGTPLGDSFAPPADISPEPGIDSPPKLDVPTPVPEPGSMMLMLTGAGGLLIRRLRDKRR
jgi:hypothetical protein